MIKINNTGQATNVGRLRKTAKAQSGFTVESSNSETNVTTAQTSSAHEAKIMTALIGLQSQGKGSTKTFAAARNVLEKLESLQRQLLDGPIGRDDLKGLEQAAAVRAHGEADANLLAIYDEINLRARVELAKLGR